MNRDIRIDIRLARHWKFRKLKRIVGPCALEHLILFWGSVAEQIPNGQLNGWSTDDIEDAADWSGERGEFANALLECRFLDRTEEGYYPHDWEEHQPWVIGADERKEQARKAGKASAAARKKNKDRAEENPEVGDGQSTDSSTDCSTDSSTGVQLNSNPRTPSPLPSPSPKAEEKSKSGVPDVHDAKFVELLKGVEETLCRTIRLDERDQIRRWFARYEDDDILKACRKGRGKARNLNYVETILKEDAYCAAEDPEYQFWARLAGT